MIEIHTHTTEGFSLGSTLGRVAGMCKMGPLKHLRIHLIVMLADWTPKVSLRAVPKVHKWLMA